MDPKANRGDKSKKGEAKKSVVTEVKEVAQDVSEPETPKAVLEEPKTNGDAKKSKQKEKKEKKVKKSKDA